MEMLIRCSIRMRLGVRRWNTLPDTVVEGEWLHVLASYDSREITNTPRLYINGEEQTVRVQRLPVGFSNSVEVKAFSRPEAGSLRDGQMDEVVFMIGYWIRRRFHHCLPAMPLPIGVSFQLQKELRRVPLIR